jgi:hypothetical protein
VFDFFYKAKAQRSFVLFFALCLNQLIPGTKIKKAGKLSLKSFAGFAGMPAPSAGIRVLPF